MEREKGRKREGEKKGNCCWETLNLSQKLK
jgi:hypothetical protein